MSKPLRYGTFASGCCAATVAWKPLGWKPVFFSENAAFASKILQYHYPDVPNLGDMNHAHNHPVFQNEPVDAIFGGTPCQDFSLAGLRAGMGGPNGNLALQFLRLLDQKRPTWMGWENVPGVFSSYTDSEADQKGRIWQSSDFATFIAGLVEIGYGVAWRVLDAQNFGVPQQRERVFVVGHIGGQWQRAAAVLFDSESLRRHPAKVPKARSVVAALTASGARKSGKGDAGGDQLIVMAHGQKNAEVVTGKSPTLTCNHEAPILFNAMASPGGLGKRSGDIAPTIRAGQGPALAVFQPVVEVAPTLTAGTHNQGPGTNPDSAESLVLAFHSKQSASRDMNPSDMVPTLGKNSAKGAAVFDLRNGSMSDVAHTIQVGGNSPSVNTIPRTLAPAGIRRLTPRECERLMGLPDDYTRIPMKRFDKPKITKLRPADMWEDREDGWWLMSADGPRYEVIGNSMAVPVLDWIGRRIQEVHNLP